MNEIIVDTGLRSRLESLGDRKRVLVWSAFVAILLAAFALYPRVAGPAPAIAPPATVPATAAAGASGPDGAVVFVHVSGAVAKPGLYELPEGTRVADAVEAAGGPGRRADLDAINLAEVLRDGLKIVVPIRGHASLPAPATSPSTGIVDLNTADQPALETIPGVGPVTATAILQHRSEIGSFETIEQLLDVTGIGPATLEALRPYVTV